MTIHDLVLFAFILPTIFIVLWMRDRLRIQPPMKRIGLGAASFLLACIVWVATMAIRPTLSAQAYIWDFVVMTSSALCSGLLILSVMQIVGGAVQVFQRWRYYRRTAAKQP